MQRDEKKKKYDAVCSQCGKKTSVSFVPDGVRPVYCPDCLQKTREATLQPFQSFKKTKKEPNPEEVRKAIEEAMKDEKK